MLKSIYHYILCLVCIQLCVSISSAQQSPEPPGWYAGDIHVHRSCDGSEPRSTGDLPSMMKTNNLSVISVLGDMGNNNSADRVEDLNNVGVTDSPLSDSNHIIHYAAEWHWDADQWKFPHQALGGHLILLGLKKAHKIWAEYPYKILKWAADQNTVRGFAHMQYLDGQLPQNLNCCLPMDYPIEAALGNIEFISEEQSNGRENAITAFYKLLNCGIRIALAGGTDYPCNDVPPGEVLTYVQVPDKKLTYVKWIDGIRRGRTVISRNGHSEFIDLKVNDSDGPGSDIRSKNKQRINLSVSWSTNAEQSGTIEIVVNGKVIAEKHGISRPRTPLVLSTTHSFDESSWICARRIDSAGKKHLLHTSAAYVTIHDKPVRASREDAEYFIRWIDNILKNIERGGIWNKYFQNDLQEVKTHYHKARKVYELIAAESR